MFEGSRQHGCAAVWYLEQEPAPVHLAVSSSRLVGGLTSVGGPADDLFKVYLEPDQNNLDTFMASSFAIEVLQLGRTGPLDFGNCQRFRHVQHTC